MLSVQYTNAATRRATAVDDGGAHRPAGPMRRSGAVGHARLWIGGSLLALGFSGAPAIAQDAATGAAATGGDIVVTAQRREQRLKDVGIAVTAVGGRTLQQANITQATDLVNIVPSLKMNASSPAAAIFNIRGVAQNDFGDQQEPPIAVYQDDSYSSSINTTSFPIFDLQRVEVLRGPQGTLFGRNATGGAVQFISNQPKRKFGGYATVQVGRYGELITEAAVTGPIADNLQFRLSGIRDRDKGYIDNINPGYPSVGANNHWALRGILAWQPAPKVQTTLTLRYMRAHHERQAGLYPFATACPNAQLQGETLGTNQTCDFFQGIGTPGPGTSATGYRNDVIDPTRGGSPWKTAATDPSFLNRAIFGASFKLQAELGRVTLVSVTDYQHATKFYIEDGDSSPTPGVIFGQTSRLKQASEEIRALIDLGSNQLTVGGYALAIKGSYTATFADPFANYLPEAVFSQRTHSLAAFVQDEWTIAQGLKLTAGVRYWRDKRRGSYTVSEPNSGVLLTFNPREVSYASFGVTQPAPGLIASPRDARPTFDGITARAQIDYKPNDNLLLYASYNRGSKSGGFTFSSATPFPGNEVAALNSIPYKPETLNAYEVGAKWTIMPGTTLDVAAFYYDYKDYQAFSQYGPIQTVLNLDAKSKGLEVEFATRPMRGLNLSLSGSFLKTNVNNVLLPDLVTVVSHDLPQSPGFSGHALARYEFAALGGTASVQADAQYSGKFCFTLLCAPVEKEKSYTVANARIGYSPAGERWELAAFVQNIFSERYRVFAFDDSLFDGTVAGVYAKPRTYGLSATVRFGDSR